MEISYKTEDESIRIKIVYLVAYRFTRYRRNKYWPKVTQCLIFCNDLLYSHGEVVKHQRDEDNQHYAYKQATKKALVKMPAKDIKKSLYKSLLNKIAEETK